MYLLLVCQWIGMYIYVLSMDSEIFFTFCLRDKEKARICFSQCWTTAMHYVFECDKLWEDFKRTEIDLGPFLT